MITGNHFLWNWGEEDHIPRLFYIDAVHDCSFDRELQLGKISCVELVSSLIIRIPVKYRTENSANRNDSITCMTGGD